MIRLALPVSLWPVGVGIFEIVSVDVPGIGCLWCPVWVMVLAVAMVAERSVRCWSGMCMVEMVDAAVQVHPTVNPCACVDGLSAEKKKTAMSKKSSQN